MLETTEEVWRKLSLLKAQQQKIGKLVADFDLLIASTAMVNKLTVDTLNIRDFSKIDGVNCED